LAGGLPKLRQTTPIPPQISRLEPKYHLTLDAALKIMFRPGRAGLTWLLAGLIFGQMSMFLYKPQEKTCAGDERDPLSGAKPKNPPIKWTGGSPPLPAASNAPVQSNSIVKSDGPQPSFVELVNRAVDVEKFVVRALKKPLRQLFSHHSAPRPYRKFSLHIVKNTTKC
jgi:hypothetical protein